MPIVEDIADVTLERTYKLDAPQGVRGRNSDNSRILEKLGWVVTVGVLYAQKRVAANALPFAAVDFLLGILFAIGFVRTAGR